MEDKITLENRDTDELQMATALKRKKIFQTILRFSVIGLLALFILFSFLGEYQFFFQEFEAATLINTTTYPVMSYALTIIGPETQFNVFGFFSIITSVASVILLLVSKNEKVTSVAILLTFFALISFFIKPEYYALTNLYDQYTSGGLTYDGGPFAILAIICIVLAAVSVYAYSLDMQRISVRSMVEMALLIGLAVVMDLPFMKIRLQANGGSISFEMLPLILLCLRHGPIKGFLASGVIFGFVSCLIGGYGLAYFPFDYLLAFGVLAIFGFFAPLIFAKGKKPQYSLSRMWIMTAVMILVVALRILSHTISGVIFWETEIVASLIYNIPAPTISGIVVLVALLVLYRPLAYINNRYPGH